MKGKTCQRADFRAWQGRIATHPNDQPDTLPPPVFMSDNARLSDMRTKADAPGATTTRECPC